ncbi:MAG: ComEC/Rec2 family competence protein [Candidatus Kerfeldbacteria bacterium]|nr:ComEC/Rec2 family competence protein [Candidatus Kerfeldbacteria bacterium]
MSVIFIVSAAIGVGVGVVFGFVWSDGIWIACGLAGVGMLRFPRASFALLIGLVIGWGRVVGFEVHDPAISFSGEMEMITGVVLKNSDIRIDHQRIVLADVERVNASFHNRLFMFAPLYPSIQAGDRVQLTCELKKPEPVEEFRYDQWLKRHHIAATCSFPRGVVVSSRPLSFTHRLYRLSDWMGERMSQALAEPEAGLLRGLLLGEQHAMSDETLEFFNRTGTTHIVALSGFNVTILLGLLDRMARIKRLRPPHRVALSATLVLLFLVMTGMDASLVRASLMGLAAVAASVVGRRSVFPIVISLVGAGMVLVNPYVLLYDAGFQLSFLATLGLFTLSSRIERFVQWVPNHFMIRDSCVATLAATIATLPIMILTFHRMSFVAPLANVLILPLVPLAMALGVIVILLPHWLPATLVYAVLHMILLFATTLSRIPYSSVSLSF